MFGKKRQPDEEYNRNKMKLEQEYAAFQKEKDQFQKSKQEYINQENELTKIEEKLQNKNKELQKLNNEIKDKEKELKDKENEILLINYELKNSKDLLEKNKINTPTLESNINEKNKININTASIDEIKTLPHIHIIQAEKLIQMRENGDYVKSFDDLADKLDFKPYKITILKNFITIDNTTRKSQYNDRLIDI